MRWEIGKGGRPYTADTRVAPRSLIRLTHQVDVIRLTHQVDFIRLTYQVDPVVGDEFADVGALGGVCVVHQGGGDALLGEEGLGLRRGVQVVAECVQGPHVVDHLLGGGELSGWGGVRG